MVCEPKRDLGDAHGPLLDLDAVELMDIDLGEAADLIERERLLLAVLFEQDVEFERAEFAVGNNEEVAAAAGGIEEFEAREPCAEVGKARLKFLDPACG